LKASSLANSSVKNLGVVSCLQAVATCDAKGKKMAGRRRRRRRQRRRATGTVEGEHAPLQVRQQQQGGPFLGAALGLEHDQGPVLIERRQRGGARRALGVAAALHPDKNAGG